MAASKLLMYSGVKVTHGNTTQALSPHHHGLLCHQIEQILVPLQVFIIPIVLACNVYMQEGYLAPNQQPLPFILDILEPVWYGRRPLMGV